MSSFSQPHLMTEETEGTGSRNLPKVWRLVRGLTDHRFYESHSQVPGQHPVKCCALPQALGVLPRAGAEALPLSIQRSRVSRENALLGISMSLAFLRVEEEACSYFPLCSASFVISWPW